MNQNIRFLFFLLLATVTFYSSHAQVSADNVPHPAYLFPEFINGSVRMKSGALEQAPLNYNVDKQGIVFKKAGQYYDLTGLEAIDTVYINDKKFVPANGAFYEVIRNTPFELYATYTGKRLPVTATAEHDGSLRKESSQVSNTVTDVYVTRQYRGDYAVEFRKQHWVRQYRTFYKANNEKQVLKVFPKKEAAIRAFINENKIDFANEADLVKLLAFCYDARS